MREESPREPSFAADVRELMMMMWTFCVIARMAAGRSQLHHQPPKMTNTGARRVRVVLANRSGFFAADA